MDATSLPPEADARLLAEIAHGDVRGAEKQLEDGGTRVSQLVVELTSPQAHVQRILMSTATTEASLNGSHPDYIPIHFAARCGHTKVIEMLAKRGANVEAAVPREVPGGWEGQALPKGARTLHAAVASGRLGAIQAVLEAGADPNSQDGKGNTPLLAAVNIRCDGGLLRGLDIVKVLLSWGADPLLANHRGITPMYYAAGFGDTDVIDMIFAVVPAALNVGNSTQGTTALGRVVDSEVLCLRDRERMVGHLLSLGATDKAVPVEVASALVRAVRRDDMSVVRILHDASRERLEDFWGPGLVSYAIELAAGHGLAKMVKTLLMVEGEDRQKHWARVPATNIPALHRAAACGSAPTVGVLLAAGADEQTRDHKGRCASDCAGVGLPVDTTPTDSMVSAVMRALERAPAFRARSWAWSATAISAQGGDTGVGSAAAEGARESRRAPADVRIFRPKGRRFFATRFERYPLKL